MKFRPLLFALVAGGMLLASPALAQNSFTGAVKGVITDKDTGNAVAGATVVISGPSLQGTQAEITDASGNYQLSALPPGNYLITVYYANAQFERPNVLIRLGKTGQVNVKINLQAGEGETITIEGRAPLIDQGSTKTGRTITPDYTQNIPTGRTFGAVLGAAAGSQGDLYGVSFGGSTSAENIYIVEGLNTTDPAYGLLSTNLPNEFVQETELITGGYNAEYGRSTGGVVNIVTKSGTNEFHGSVFSYFTPGQLVADEIDTPSAASSVNLETELDFNWDVGAEVGGPIIKDRLWFHAGFNPSFRNTTYDRIIKRRVDKEDIDMDGVPDGDGNPDEDANGFQVTEEVGRTSREISRRIMYFTAKLTGSVTPDHQGSISYLGNPTSSDTYVGNPGTVSGDSIDTETGATDISGKWTSKFFNNKTQVDVVLGYHKNVRRSTPRGEGGNGLQLIHLTTRALTDFEFFEQRDHGDIPAGCVDGDESVDDFPDIRNCPVNFYNIGGVGFRENEDTTRLAAQIFVTQRVKAAGHHEFKAGADFEHQRYDHLREFTGGSGTRILDFGIPALDRFYQILGPDFEDQIGQEAMFNGVDQAVLVEGCDIGLERGPVPCRRLIEGQQANTTTQNISAFVRDSWQVLPNLTVNAGIRWEQQNLLVADQIEGSFDWANGEPVSSDAITISNMVAPRLGIIYDPTQEGRSKIFGHYGRFYESIPMDINSRAFGGEVFYRRWLGPNACSFDAVATPDQSLDPGADGSGGFLNSCDESDQFFAPDIFGGGTEQVVPGLGGQYINELVVGGEYELLNDLKVGIQYELRNLGRAIEDISIDGGTTYVIANPGQIDADGVRAEYDCNGADSVICEQLLASADFDKPTRDYNALTLTAEKRFSRNLMLLASYTYARNRGNFPGLFSPETGQLDPNLTSMYDLPELMANRTGPLRHDRPHNFKLDGYYSLDAKEVGFFNFGASVRAISGVPHNTLGRHISYGARESYILPRGTAPRSPFTTQFDVQAAYGRNLSKDISLQAFVRVFNVFNQQAGTSVDEEYTSDVINPIVGGDEDDLRHAKELRDRTTGNGLNNNIAEKDPNFGNITARQAPLQMTFGMRLIF